MLNPRAGPATEGDTLGEVIDVLLRPSAGPADRGGGRVEGADGEVNSRALAGTAIVVCARASPADRGASAGPSNTSGVSAKVTNRSQGRLT